MANLGSPIVTKATNDFFHLILDDIVDVLLVGQDLKVSVNLLKQSGVFIGQLVLFQVHQLAKSHCEDGVGLNAG